MEDCNSLATFEEGRVGKSAKKLSAGVEPELCAETSEESCPWPYAGLWWQGKASTFFQSAYRKKHSCETALLCIHNEALWAMEEQNVISLVAIDLSAAFDTDDHEVLRSVLQRECGIGGYALC